MKNLARIAFSLAPCLFSLSPTSSLAAAAAQSDKFEQTAVREEPALSLSFPGIGDASKAIREVSFDELSIDLREMTTGTDVEYRLYGPGATHWGSARLDFACDARVERELAKLLKEQPFADGKTERKSISIVLRDRSKHEATHVVQQRKVIVRGWDPTKVELVQGTLSGPKCRLRLTLALSDVAFQAAEGPEEPRMAAEEAPSRYRVAIIDRGGGRDVDTAWESVTGGEEMTEITETTVGSDKYQTTTPGHKTVGELTLRGAMTQNRKSVLDWVNDSAACGRRDARRKCRSAYRSLEVTELVQTAKGLSEGRKLLCIGAFVTGYKLPRLGASEAAGSAQEEVRIKPVRCELK